LPEQQKTTLNLTMRPRTFDEVIGLGDQVSTLKAKIAEGVPRGFIFTGPFGCGKTTLAWLVAKEIQGPFFEGTPQVMEINGANYRKIEDMRNLAKTCGAYPMQGQYSVILMDECHKLTKDAQEILLKELEVPNSPTVWMLCTTDPEKLNRGVRDRCFPVKVEGMSAPDRDKLVARAAAELKHLGDTVEFRAALAKANVTSPRRILLAFEAYHYGMPAVQAVNSMTSAAAPEYHDIAFSVIYGAWDKDVTVSWAGNKVARAIGVQLKELDERLKKSAKTDTETEEPENAAAVDDDDLVSKTEAAQAIRAIVAAFLKGQILPTQAGKSWKHKPENKCLAVYEAMYILANHIPADAYEMQWPGLIAVLWKVNSKLRAIK
jgi:DNA polymerase III delta prime subunit